MGLEMIQKFVEIFVHTYIAEETFAYGARTTFEETYENPSTNNKVKAIGMFVHLRCIEVTPMADHLNEIKSTS